MAKRPMVEFILQVTNLVFTLWGLSTLGYGLICFFKWKQSLSKEIRESNTKQMIAHRLLLAIDSLKHSSDSLPKPWFIYLLIGIGAFLFIISCIGYVGTASRSPCGLLSIFLYCVFLVVLVIVELGTSAFIFFEHNWKKVIPKDRSGTLQRVYHFLHVNWKIIRWVALGVFILQVIAMVLAVYLRSVFKRARYDNSDDDEHIVYLPRARVKPNYRMVTPTITSTPSTTTTANGRDPTKPTKLQ
ncbi:tobamovirus multiplication protein 2A-like [Gastrolobium bilobum]|uniref:tobamovirus multiplication protein 2A-like n=1 Tax=Gastrolobium bilobum TaxID=150636 RepID=UPI002AB134F3|nr:tobamovirus multiplication protein 2A-like [Gastrolobium bilobum]